jgi:hypothetical protein
MTDWWTGLTALEKIFAAFAVPFSLLTLLQLLIELLGIGSDHGGHGVFAMDHDMGGFFDHFTFFSVRNLIYFLMMFGWTGLACSKAGLPTFWSVFIAILAGLATTLIIGFLFFTFLKLNESGNIRIESALGQVGTVYISIPGGRHGTGVVQLVMQGVTQEMNAMTNGEKLHAGAAVKVLEVVEGNILLVSKV